MNQKMHILKNFMSMNVHNCKGKGKKRQIQKLEHYIEREKLIPYKFLDVEEEIKDLEFFLYIELTSCNDLHNVGQSLEK